MKFRDDFITNSSSTSFILSMKDEVNKKNFMNEIGISEEFPISKIFDDLFETIQHKKEEIHQYIRSSNDEYKSVEEFLESEGYDTETIFIVKKLINEGRTVYYGKISSDGDTSAEVFFCMESFLVCEGDIYFNGEIGGW
ncbi:hypothetical protein [Clostridium botulinum]|uniref:hypothetical protein n=1 Tax=Clostridium botulinum TaxID=1491 RepID=UPI000773A5D8|nr:hypothetical protein [Clostridium botulinum]